MQYCQNYICKWIILDGVSLTIYLIKKGYICLVCIFQMVQQYNRCCAGYGILNTHRHTRLQDYTKTCK